MDLPVQNENWEKTEAVDCLDACVKKDQLLSFFSISGWRIAISLIASIVTIICFLLYGRDALMFVWPICIVLLPLDGVILGLFGDVVSKCFAFCLMAFYYHSILWPVFGCRDRSKRMAWSLVSMLILSAAGILYFLVLKQIDFD